MIKIEYNGRLGNNLIQYAASYILAKKAGLQLDTPVYTMLATPEFRAVFKINSLTGRKFNNFIEVFDHNYFRHLRNPIRNKGYFLKGYFQHKRLLVDCRQEILNLYKPPESDFIPSKNDAFVACRLGDCLVAPRTYCSVEYIEDQLVASRDSYDKVYVTSDTINHPPLIDLIKRYDLTIYQNGPLGNISFASQFNNLILSAGSFSYWMAYLSSAENITVYHNHRADSLQENNAWDYNKNVKFTK